MRWQNERFQERVKTFTGWTAQIIQHELDHCQGIVIRQGQNLICKRHLGLHLAPTLRPDLFHGNRGQRDNGAEHIAKYMSTYDNET